MSIDLEQQRFLLAMPEDDDSLSPGQISPEPELEPEPVEKEADAEESSEEDEEEVDAERDQVPVRPEPVVAEIPPSPLALGKVISAKEAPPPLISVEPIIPRSKKSRSQDARRISRGSTDSLDTPMEDGIDTQIPYAEKETVDVGFLLTEQRSTARYVPRSPIESDKPKKGVFTKRYPKKRNLELESAAGSLSSLPVLRRGDVFGRSTNTSVRVGGRDSMELPGAVGVKTGLVLRSFVRTHCPLIEDVSGFSKKAARSPPPDIWVIDDQKDVDIDEFYGGEAVPFVAAARLSMHKIPALRHPLQERRRIEPPSVGILGVPTEW
jgi:hypothetical protein